jgi:hypothetical protein
MVRSKVELIVMPSLRIDGKLRTLYSNTIAFS